MQVRAFNKKRKGNPIHYHLDGATGSGGGSDPQAFLRSSGDINAPVVGDVLYVEYERLSGSREFEDLTSSGTSVQFKRNGVNITLNAGDKMYRIKSTDVGALISATLTVIDQTGATEYTADLTTGANVTGSSDFVWWDLQENFKAMYDMRFAKFPFMIHYQEDNPEEAQGFRTLNGQAWDLYTYALTKAMLVDEANQKAYPYDLLEFTQYYLRNPLPVVGAEFTLMLKCKFQFDGTLTFFSDFGPSNYLQYQSSTLKRITSLGTNMPANSAPLDTWLNILITHSNTPFEDVNGVTGRGSEWIVKQQGGVQNVTAETTNNFTDVDFESFYGCDTVLSTVLFARQMEIACFAITDHVFTKEERQDIINSLDAIPSS